MSNNILYRELIKDMVWSYSRASAFESCSYKWFLRYIKEYDSADTFFASYGSFIHKIIEEYYNGELSVDRMKERYLCGFKENVRGDAPNPKVFTTYFNDGLNYFENFVPFPFKKLATEDKVEFDVNGIKMVGFIDFLGTDGNDELVIVDNKSRMLKPRSGRKKPTKSDRELDEYLKQQYLYAIGVRKKYGRYPKWLCFNCYREQTLIKEPFDENKCEEACRWFADIVFQTADETEFRPDIEWFKCQFLCEQKNNCEYFELTGR